MPAFNLHGAHAIMWAKQSAMMGVHQSQTDQPQSWDCCNDSISHWEGLTRFKLNTDSGGSHSLAPNKIMNIKTNCLVLLTGQAGNRSENGKLDCGSGLLCDSCLAFRLAACHVHTGIALKATPPIITSQASRSSVTGEGMVGMPAPGSGINPTASSLQHPTAGQENLKVQPRQLLHHKQYLTSPEKDLCDYRLQRKSLGFVP